MLHIDGLTQKKLVIATPMYGGQCTGHYMQGMMTLTSLCTSYGVTMRTVVIGDSLVTRARNRCVDIFKATCTDPEDRLMFIDSDVQFNASDVLRLLMMDKYDVIGALYPLKQINWKRVKNIIQRNPDYPAEELPKAASDYVFNFIIPEGNKGTIQVGEPTEVRDLGTGFMMIKRSVFDKIEEAGLAKAYNPCHNEEIYSGPQVYDHFPCGIDKELGLDGDGQYLSEDWVFCRRWQKLGGKIYACPWIKLSHFGPMGFQGDLTALALSGAKIGEEFCQVQ